MPDKKPATTKKKPAVRKRKPTVPSTYAYGLPGNNPPIPEGVHQPVTVDGTNRRSDDDALAGQLVDVIRGPHKGRRGVFLHPTTHDAKTGFPHEIMILTRDNEHEHLVVAYKDVRPPRTVR